MGAALTVNSSSIDEALRRKVEYKIAQSSAYSPDECVKLCAELRELLLLAKAGPPPKDVDKPLVKSAPETADAVPELPVKPATIGGQPVPTPGQPLKAKPSFRKTATESIVAVPIPGENNLENRWLAYVTSAPRRRFRFFFF